MPNYAATLQRSIFEDGSARTRSLREPVAPLARLLAEFHTSMNMVGLRCFAGNMDRFMVFCLLLRTSLSHGERRGTISVHSAAMSLGRPFETIRRHICTLVDQGICERTPAGVMLSYHHWEQPESWQRLRFSHDCFVRLIADGVACGAIPAKAGGDQPCLSLDDGACAAADLILALVDTNRFLCEESIDLAIFSAVLHGNHRLYASDPTTALARTDTLRPHHAVRVAQVARALALPDTTVRRRIAPFTRRGGLYVRTPTGLLVATDRLRSLRECDSSSSARHGSIRLIIKRAVARGLSLARSERSYCDGRPATPTIE